MVTLNKRNGLFGRVWADDDLTAAEDQPTDFSGLTSLGYVRGAVRRGMAFWICMALAGVLLGVGLYMKSPPVYQAATTLVLKVGPEAAPGTAIQNEQVVAQSRPVAELALKALKLPEDVDTFLQSYTVTVITDQALRITADAPSSNQAVTQAKALATAFLAFRTSELKAQQASYFQALDQALAQQKAAVATLKSEIRAASHQPGQQARLKNLRAQRTNAVGTLSTLVQQFNDEKASVEETTAQQLKESNVADPAAPVPQSRHGRLKHLITYGVIGLIVGLTLGLGIVIVRGLVSDRLRRRDDIAYALGCPVKLSVGRVEGKRLFGRRGIDAVKSREIQRIAGHLRRCAPRNSRGAAALAVVPVDSLQAAALSVTGLALSCAGQGQRVMLADLAPGSPVASLLDSPEPGVRLVKVDGRQLAIVVPGPDEDLPSGPLGGGASQQVQPALAKAAESADLMLTLAVLDPSTGGDHLATWAADAVVIVTAGRSSWTKVHAVSEMIRLAGVRLVSAVLVGADKTDESLGVTQQLAAGRESELADDRLRAGAEGPLVAVERNRNRGGGQPDDR
jgi:capsular polysaccharide biosynthesis protein